ncbi:hypothetical protein LX69_02897 [Breznakibacter xylanolyticus]|uniref:Cell division protein FtsL n=1 Tax=Breznakibacter xylanolyticus TaxID=990 RepID=A0A2W7MWU3_9BACT|nr:FtsL-like putative cell division protein [Breznakibacter xylanolyticus]MBN2743282.1 hypothetical protein [Marinilabiliaceae bacterium]PZX12428.1 hypothetical protein LX69_02897 [Breznakibacter xylanolyticus]
MFGKVNKHKIREFLDGHEELKELRRVRLRDFLTGEIFTRPIFSKHVGYLLFIIFLAFCYIANHYKVEELVTRLAVVNKELKELRSEAITTSSQLMNISKQSEVLRRIREEGIDLEPLREPPRILDVD